MWPLIIGAAMSALKSKKDQERYAKEKQVEATAARWSPWTGMQQKSGPTPDAMGTMMQGLMAGWMMGQQNGWGGMGQKPSGQVAPMQQPRMGGLQQP